MMVVARGRAGEGLDVADEQLTKIYCLDINHLKWASAQDKCMQRGKRKTLPNRFKNATQRVGD
jgi:hypothetical protein